MKLHLAGVMSAALVTGLAGSVAAYRAQVAEDVSVAEPTVVSSSSQPTEHRTRFRWAPCPQGSQLEAGVCVTDVVRTVVVPAAPVSVPAPGTAPVVATTNAHEDDQDEGYDDREDRDEDDDHDEQDEQDEHGEEHEEEHDQDEDDD